MKKMLRKRKIVVLTAAAVLLLVSYLLYSRPMTLSQLYPSLTLDKCVEISGYYEDGKGVSFTNFTAEKDTEAYESLWEMLYEQKYRRSLRDLMPRRSRTHRYQPGDFQWEVIFRFDTVEFPDGNSASGSLLRIQYWYGDLDIHFNGGVRSCHTSEQDTWAKEILDIIR